MGISDILQMADAHLSGREIVANLRAFADRIRCALGYEPTGEFVNSALSDP